MQGNIMEKNKFAIATLQAVKENVMKHKKPIYNPVYITGLTREERFRIFFTFFNKDFNSVCKGKKISCKELKKKEEIEINRDLIIMEDVDVISNKSILQEKLYNILNNCIKNNVQVILCTNEHVDNLAFYSQLKSVILSGITLYLEK